MMAHWGSVLNALKEARCENTLIYHRSLERVDSDCPKGRGIRRRDGGYWETCENERSLDNR